MGIFGQPSPKEEQRAAAFTEWLRKRNPLALASIVLGVFSLTHFGTLLVDAIAAIVCGSIAITQLSKNSSPQTEGKRLAIAGIALGAVSLAIASALYLKR